jgi:hypothetical protein
MYFRVIINVTDLAPMFGSDVVTTSEPPKLQVGDVDDYSEVVDVRCQLCWLRRCNNIGATKAGSG